MRVFVAGATGVLGRALVPQLVARGHEVVGMTRSASKQDLVRSLGARAVVADALDPDAVAQAVASAEPEADPLDPNPRGRGADRVAARLPVDGGLAALARRAPLGASPARDLRGRVAAGAAGG